MGNKCYDLRKGGRVTILWFLLATLNDEAQDCWNVIYFGNCPFYRNSISQVNTLQQCMKNMLASFTKHRHIIHAGYTFAGKGSWILQVEISETVAVSDPTASNVFSLRMEPIPLPTSRPPSKSTTFSGSSDPMRTRFLSACTVARRENGSRWFFCPRTATLSQLCFMPATKFLYRAPSLHHSERIMFNLQNEANWQLIIRQECNLLGKRKACF